MPFGFKKPSRSYAASANAYYDPVSGYPTPYDPQTRAIHGPPKGYGRADEDSSDDEYGGSRVRRRDHVPGQQEDRHRRSSYDATPIARKKSSTLRTSQRGAVGRQSPASDVGRSSQSHSHSKSKKASQHVHYAETPEVPVSVTSPSQMMRSASKAGVKANSQVERQRRNQNVRAAMATFSPVDLAPPAPKSRKGLDDENEEAHSDQEGSWAGRSDGSDDIGSGADSSAPQSSVGPDCATSIARAPEHIPPQPVFAQDDVSEAEAEADSENCERDVSHQGMQGGNGIETIENDGCTPGSGKNSRTPSPAAELGRPTLRLERYNEHGELTPPTSDPGALSNLVAGMSCAESKSYDAASPWTAPMASHSVSPSHQSRPESRSSQGFSMGVFDRLSSKLGGKEEQVSRKYALSPPLSPLGPSVGLTHAPQAVSFGSGGEHLDGISGAERDSTHDMISHSRAQPRATKSEAPSTPVAHATLAPPVLALQPPTPQHDLTQTPFHTTSLEESSANSESDPPQSPAPQVRSSYTLSNDRPFGTPLGNSVFSDERDSTQRPGSNSSSRSSSHSNKAVPDMNQNQGQAQRTTAFPGAQRSASPTPPQSSAPSAPSSTSGKLPAPMNPHQPAFLKWDPANQRWIPVPVLSSNALPPPRPESVVSSASAYSQMSAVKPTGLALSATQARRQSLPTLALSPARSVRRAPSPSMSSYSRPASPSQAPILASPIAGSSFVGRRMSIDPPYLMNANTLTLLPEMQEVEADPSVSPYSPRSAPHSRAPSIDGRGSNVGINYRSSFSSYRPRDSQVFPQGYDVNARVADMARGASGSRASSINGDSVSEGEKRWRDNYGHSRDSSIYQDNIPYEESEYERGSQMGSAFGRAPTPSMNGGKSKDLAKPGRESALDVMSVRGDSVQLLGSDGTDQPTSGYTSLVLPSGAYVPSDPTKSSDKLDHRLLGMPHATMSTITVSDSSVPSGRRSSLGGLIHHRDTATPAHLRAELPPPVAFSSHQSPPTKISASQVLVQVHAVSLDKFDSDMVKEKATSGSGAGKWIPGRSFVGRALNVGADVRVIAKGDIVMGLVDIRKSGCLAEYIVCERRRLARIPLGVNLSLEEVSCLPLLGVTAHRACVGQTRGSRALILNAHEGVGALVAQELSSMGLHVIAHVPLDVDNAEDDAWDNGAKEVFADDAVAMINAQHESGFEFVLDTIGGRRIYDACRRVLRTNGVFVTLYGDDAEHVPSGPQVKSSLHALRRAFVKKDKKAISYVHLLPGGADIDVSGQDTRDILELPVMTLYRPKVGMVVPFERAPEAFEELASLVSGGVREESGTVVVRLSN